jgi:hypothetical protein
VPLRNRVTPFGEIVATPEHGTLFGNRGLLHDAEGRIVRDHRGERWIACALEFKGRRRPLLRPGRYTELFFLDEATAMAAGHRPCAECRRGDARRFREAWARAGRGPATARLTEVDRDLHRDRLDAAGGRRRRRAPAGDLADGVMVADGAEALLVLGPSLLPWSPGGYGSPRPRPAADAVLEVLTPSAIAAAIAAGYRPALHPSAGAA